MLRYAVIFLALAIAAGLAGFGLAVSLVASVAKLFSVFSLSLACIFSSGISQRGECNPRYGCISNFRLSSTCATGGTGIFTWTYGGTVKERPFGTRYILLLGSFAGFGLRQTAGYP